MLRYAGFGSLLGLFALLGGCSGTDDSTGLATPGGPYRLSVETSPHPPRIGDETRITTRLTHSADDRPVQNLQILHERVIHNFIVNLDFSSFAHIHHEDFAPLTDHDLKTATLHFPYTFPRAGHYRMVSEFTHRGRGWTKHFDFTLGDPPSTPIAIDLAQEKDFGAYRARLSTSPAQPLAGFETELVLELSRGDQPVTDLELILGSEVHVALWRLDGTQFGHAHTYTPHMAMMLAAMHDRDKTPQARAEAMDAMMIEMMNAPAEQVFTGPRLPVHHVFPQPGTYAVFLQCAPGGRPQVFDFMLEVVAYEEGMDTRIESMLDISGGH